MKTLIIGCGSIGAYKPDPYDSSDNDNEILTHAHAEIVKGKAGDELVLFDTDKEKANEAYRKWIDLACEKRIHLFLGYYDLIDADKIIIATPAETHLGVVDERVS